MTPDEVKERIWKIADAAARGLIPRPSISVDVGVDEEDIPAVLPAARWLWWELEFSGSVRPVEIAFHRADELLQASPELGLNGEEFGESCMALTGSIDL
jgi:hypothetical protein